MLSEVVGKQLLIEISCFERSVYGEQPKRLLVNMMGGERCSAVICRWGERFYTRGKRGKEIAGRVYYIRL